MHLNGTTATVKWLFYSSANGPYGCSGVGWQLSQVRLSTPSHAHHFSHTFTAILEGAASAAISTSF